MSNELATLKSRLERLRHERAELESIRKEAFMASPPMPGGGQQMGGMPPQGGMPMDPNAMGGMPPQGGMPVDPNTGMPIDPNTGMPIDPNTGMPMDPSAMGGQPQQPQSPVTPEMIEELMGVVEELAASSEQHEKVLQQVMEQCEEITARFEDMEQRLAQMFGGGGAGPGGM